MVRDLGVHAAQDLGVHVVRGLELGVVMDQELDLDVVMDLGRELELGVAGAGQEMQVAPEMKYSLLEVCVFPAVCAAACGLCGDLLNPNAFSAEIRFHEMIE